MKIYALFVYKNGIQGPVNEIYNIDEYNFFQKRTIKEVLLFGSNLVYNRVKADIEKASIESITYKEYQINISSGGSGGSGNEISYVLITDKDYNSRIIINLFKTLRHSDTRFDSETEIRKIISEDHYKTDNLLRVKSELNETVEIVKKTIDSVIDRGTTLERLVKESEDLSLSSKMFYKQAKNNNKCCLIM